MRLGLGWRSANTLQSQETSSLHIDLISDLKRINAHICSIAHPILDAARALAPNRLRSLTQPEAPPRAPIKLLLFL